MSPAPELPPDETPFPADVPLDVPPQHLETANYTASLLAEAAQHAATSIGEILGQAQQHLDAAATSAVMPVHELVGAASVPLDQAQAAMAKVYNQVVTKAIAPLDAAQRSFLNNGVSIPLNDLEVKADLADESGTRLLARVPQFAALMSAPPVPCDANGQPCNPVPFEDPLGRKWYCPVGSHLTFYSLTQEVACYFDDGTIVPPCSADCPTDITGVGVSVPPINTPPSPPIGLPPPPPIGPPTSPPIGLPPPIVPVGSCDNPTVAVQVSCGVISKPPPPVRYWISYECADGCNVSYCIYSGQSPPTIYKGKLFDWTGPTPPPQSVIDSIADLCGVTTVVSPPGSPPTSPPSSPPTSPPGSPPSPPLTSDVEWTPASSYVDWSTPDVCGQADIFCKAGGETGLPAPAAHQVPDGVATWLSLTVDPIDANLPWIFSAVTGLYELVKGANNAVLEKTGLADEISKSTIGSSAGKIFKQVWEKGIGIKVPASFWQAASIVALADRAELLAGLPMRYLAQGYVYTMQYCSPEFIPDQAGIDSLWATGKIDDPQWECLTKAQGNIPNWWKPLRDVRTTKPNVNELVQLFMRKQVPDREELKKRAAEVGVRGDSYLNDFLTLAQQVPPITDLTRFMVRDAADDGVAKKYDYDKDFDIKFAGILKDWATWQGVPADYMKMVWRAHWEIPSPTQLYEMFHRLRPDRPEVFAWDDLAGKIGKDGAKGQLGPRPPVVTIDDVRNALEINDKAPAWIEALLAISYSPITRTDATRAYQIGEWTRGQLKNNFLDNGYSPPSAELLTSFYETQKVQRLSTLTGLNTPREAVKAYQDGTLTKTDFDLVLSLTVPNKNDRESIQVAADAQMKRKVIDSAKKWIRRYYMVAAYTENMAEDELIVAGIDATRAAQIVEIWKNDRAARLKEPTVKMLCGWRNHGLISDDDYLDRLQRLGFSYDDATRIESVCVTDWAAAQQRAQQAAADKLARQERQALKDEASALSKYETQIRQQIAALQKVLKEIVGQIKDSGAGKAYQGQA